MEIKDIIDEQGIRVSGLGIVIKKLDELIRLIDKTNLRVFHIEEKLDKIRMDMEKQ